MRTYRTVAAWLLAAACLAACDKNTKDPGEGSKDIEHDFTVELTCNTGIRSADDVKDFASFNVCVTSGEETDYTFTYSVDGNDYVVVDRIWVGEPRTITVTDTGFGKHTFEAVVSRRDNAGPTKMIAGEAWMRGNPLISLKGTVSSASGSMKFGEGGDINLYVTDTAEIDLDYQPRTTVVKPVFSISRGRLRVSGEPVCRDGHLIFMLGALEEGKDTLQVILQNGELADTLVQAFTCTSDGEKDYGLDFDISVRDLILGQKPVVDVVFKTLREGDTFTASWAMDGGAPRPLAGTLPYDQQGHAVITIPQEVMDRESHMLAITICSGMTSREVTRSQSFVARIIPLMGCRFTVEGKEVNSLMLEPGSPVNVKVVPVPEDATIFSSEMTVSGGRAQMTGSGWTRTLARRLPGHDTFRVSVLSDGEHVYELPLVMKEYLSVGISGKRPESADDMLDRLDDDRIQFTLGGLTSGFDFGSTWEVKVFFHGEASYWEALGTASAPRSIQKTDRTEQETASVSMTVKSAAKMAPLSLLELFSGIRSKTIHSSRWKDDSSTDGYIDGNMLDPNITVHEEIHYVPVIEKLEIHITPDDASYGDILVFSSGDSLVTVK